MPEANLAETGTLLKCSACLQIFRVFPPDDDISEEISEQTGRSSLPDLTNIEPIPSHLQRSESMLEGQNSPASPEPPTIELSNGATIEHLMSQPNLNKNSAGDTTDFLSSSDEFVTTSPQKDSQAELKVRNVPAGLRGSGYDAFVESQNYLSDPSEISISALGSQGVAPVNQQANGQKSWRAYSTKLWLRSPLSLRAAIAVFPIAFTVGLILGEPKVDGTLDIQDASAGHVTLSETESNKRHQGNSLKLNTESDQALRTSPSSSAVALENTKKFSTSESQPIGRTHQRHPRDHVAPENHAFVLPRKLVVRAKPKKKSQFAGRFSQGDLVRVYDTVEQWSLVYMPGGGSVGFVPSKSLGSQKTLSALIAESKFEGCRVKTHRRVSRCLEHASMQETQCMDSCGAVDDMSEGSVRCRSICSGAYEICAKSCRSRKSSKKKSKRRRVR